jgi:hypothetical protein
VAGGQQLDVDVAVASVLNVLEEGARGEVDPGQVALAEHGFARAHGVDGTVPELTEVGRQPTRRHRLSVLERDAPALQRRLHALA